MKTRREFLRSTLLGASATWTVPAFVGRTFADLHLGARDLAVQPVTGKGSVGLELVQVSAEQGIEKYGALGSSEVPEKT